MTEKLVFTYTNTWTPGAPIHSVGPELASKVLKGCWSCEVNLSGLCHRATYSRFNNDVTAVYNGPNNEGLPCEALEGICVTRRIR